MSLLDDIEQTGQSMLNRFPGWVDQAVARGRYLVGTLPEEYQAPVNAGLEVLSSNKDELAAITGESFTALLSHLSLGRVRSAELVYLRTQASFAERQKALTAATEKTIAAAEAQERIWSGLKRIGEEILKAVGKAAVPLLLAVV